MATFEKSTPKTCPTLTFSVPDFLVKVSLLPEEDLDFTIPEALSSLRLPESLQKNGLHFYSWRTSPVCYRMTTAGRSIPSSPRLLKWGIISNGWCLTANTLESHNNAEGCTLSDILMEDVRLPETVFGKGEMFLLRANGDSMVDAGIDDGDWVVIRKQNTAEEGDIVVALSDGLNNLKYFYRNKRKGCAILRSANAEKGYKDIETFDLQIQGVAQNVIKGL